jgi:hypothetical protein
MKSDKTLRWGIGAMMARRLIGRLLALAGILLVAATPASPVPPKPIMIKGEIIDSWCQVSGITSAPSGARQAAFRSG